MSFFMKDNKGNEYLYDEGIVVPMGDVSDEDFLAFLLSHQPLDNSAMLDMKDRQQVKDVKKYVPDEWICR